MTQRTATSHGVTASYARVVAAHRRPPACASALAAFRSLALATVAVGALGSAATWTVSTSLGARSALGANSPMQIEKRFALAGPYGALANATDLAVAGEAVRERFPAGNWARRLQSPIETIKAIAFDIVGSVPPHPLATARAVPSPPPRPAAAPEAEPKRLLVRLPDARAPMPRARNDTALPDPDSRTAVYDILAHTVYLPNGRRLEAHSGLGEKMDDPRYVSVRMRGPTPPNVYELTLREPLFHGVRAIRLTPVGDGSMYGRDGILAHSYMLGPNGQSNGCVSFNDYAVFLQAFLHGEVSRMVVVTHLKSAPPRALISRRRGNERYAANDE